MVLRALSLFLGALSAEGFDVARRRTLHGAQRPLEFRLAAARRLAPLRSQYDEYDEALEKSSRFVRTMQGRMLADATHPLPIRRVAELDRFARSAQFKRILAKGGAL